MLVDKFEKEFHDACEEVGTSGGGVRDETADDDYTVTGEGLDLKQTEEILVHLGFIDSCCNDDKLEFLRLWDTIMSTSMTASLSPSILFTYLLAIQNIKRKNSRRGMGTLTIKQVH